MKKVTALVSFATLLSLSANADIFTKKENPSMDRFLNPDYVMSINLKNNELAQEVCNKMSSALSEIFRYPSGDKKSFVYPKNSICLYNNRPNIKDLEQKHEYLFNIIENKETGHIDLTIQNLQASEHDFKTLKWTLKNKEKKSTLNFLEEAAVKIADYEINGEKYKNVVFYQALAKDNSLEPIDDLYFKVKGENRSVSKEVAYDEFVRKEKGVNRNYMRAAVELGTFLGIGKALYIASHEEMKADWDFDNQTLDDYKERLFTTNQMRFDDNSIGMNWGHAYAGVLYYHSARNNGFSSKESFLVALAGSSIWEYFGENKEVVSINDQVATGIGGAIIGEVAFQISHMLASKDSIVAKVISGMINPIGMLNNWLDGKSFSEYHRNFSDEYGFDENYERFDIYMGLTYLNNKKLEQTKEMLELGLEAEVINLPVNNLGKVSSVVYDPLFAELKMNTHISTNAIEDWHAMTKLVLGGYFSKDISQDENGKKQGYSYFIGPSARTDYRSRGEDHQDDFFAVVNVLGTTLDVTYYNSGMKMRFVVDIYADFAMVRPYAMNEYKDQGHDFEGAMSVLKNRGYYYSLGHTASAKLEISGDKWRAGIEAINSKFSSISNPELDRHIDKVTKTLEMEDQYRSISAYVTYSTSSSLTIMAGIERIMREGSISDSSLSDDFTRSTTEDRVYLRVQKNY